MKEDLIKYIRFDDKPLIKLALFYIVGIVLGDYLIYKIQIYPVTLIFSIAIIVVVIFVAHFLKLRVLFDVLTPLFLVIAGFSAIYLSEDRFKTDHFSSDLKEISEISLKIYDVKKTGYNTKVETEVLYMKHGLNKKLHKGKLLVIIPSKNNNQNIEPYDTLHITNPRIVKITGNKNPFTFDISNYYHYKHIDYQIYVTSDYTLSKYNGTWSISLLFRNLNHLIQKRLHRIIPSNINSNLTISILLGDTQNLDKEIQLQFSRTGITHILSVSGMHVGIMATIFIFLLRKFPVRNVLMRALKLIIILTAVWFYAFLTGNGSAVVRAATMLSLVVIGLNLKKFINPINILSLSALLMLIYDPYYLFQLSFLLSYVAMLSIFVFYDPVSKLLKIDNKILKFVWDIFAMTIAAQILMFPLILYYFHNGPVLFLLSSLIAIPMTYGAMAFGFSAVLIDLVSTQAGYYIGVLVDKILDFCIYLVSIVDDWSGNVGNYIFLDQFDLILIYLVIFLIFLYFLTGKKIVSAMVFVFMLLTMGYQSIRLVTNKKHDELAIYYIKRNIMMDFFVDGKCYNFTKIPISEEQSIFTNRNYRIYKGISDTINLNNNFYTNPEIKKQNNIFKVSDKLIVRLSSPMDYLPTYTDKINVLILDGKVDLYLNKIYGKYKIENLIITPNINYFQKTIIMHFLANNKLNFWDIGKDGAFLYKIN